MSFQTTGMWSQLNLSTRDISSPLGAQRLRFIIPRRQWKSITHRPLRLHLFPYSALSSVQAGCVQHPIYTAVPDHSGRTCSSVIYLYLGYSRLQVKPRSRALSRCGSSKLTYPCGQRVVSVGSDSQSRTREGARWGPYRFLSLVSCDPPQEKPSLARRPRPAKRLVLFVYRDSVRIPHVQGYVLLSTALTRPII